MKHLNQKVATVHICRFALIAFQAAAPLFLYSAARAQPQPTPTVHPLPSDAVLDGLLAAHKWNDLGAALSQLDGAASFAKSMDWLNSRLDSGGGLLLGILYARDLWIVGSSQPVTDPSKDMRATAGMITLYTYELIAIDGAKCEDKSAPQNRLTQLFGARRETFAYLKQLPPEWKISIVNLAIAFEKKTAVLRGEDDLICRGGLEQYRAGLTRGSQHEVPNTDGHVGKTVDVRPPADWTPSFIAPAAYQPLQQKARAEMPTTLLQLIK